MPLWSQEFIEPPWSKKHTVTLQTRDRYDELARKGGSDKIERHKPLSLAGGHGRKAGASDIYESSSYSINVQRSSLSLHSASRTSVFNSPLFRWS